MYVALLLEPERRSESQIMRNATLPHGRPAAVHFPLTPTLVARTFSKQHHFVELAELVAGATMVRRFSFVNPTIIRG